MSKQKVSLPCVVSAPPSFSVTPLDKTVRYGRRVSFHCEVTGNPPPAVLWNKEGSKVLYYPCIKLEMGVFTL